MIGKTIRVQVLIMMMTAEVAITAERLELRPENIRNIAENRPGPSNNNHTDNQIKRERLDDDNFLQKCNEDLNNKILIADLFH